MQQTDVTQGVLAVAMAPDGAVAATGGAEGDVGVWEPRTGRLRYLLHAPAGGPSDFGVRIAFAGRAPEQILVTAGASGVVRTWDTATGAPRAAARLPGFEVTDLAVSPDGLRIAAAASPTLQGGGLVAVWDAPTLAPISRVHTTASRLAFGPRDGSLVTTASGKVRVWDSRRGTLDRAFAGERDVGAAALSPDGRTAAVAENGGRVGLLDVATGEQRIALGHPGTVSAIAFSRDGSRLLTAGTDETARLWDVGDGRLLTTLRGHRSPVWYASFLGDGERVLTAGGDGAARMWRPAVPPVSRQLSGHRAVVDDIALTPDGRRVVSASEDGTARIWDVRTGRNVAITAHHAGSVDPAIAVSPDGRRLLTSGLRAPRLWDAETGRAIAMVSGNGDGGAAFTPDGSAVVGASGVVWNIARRARMAALPPFLSGPYVAQRDGQSVVLEVRKDGSAVVAVLPTGRVLTRLDGRFADPLVHASFSPDGSILATERQGATSLWNVGTGRRIAALPGEMSLPPDHAFDSSGQRLLTITEKGVRVWDVRRRQPITDLPHPRQVGSATFSPDGRLVLTASYDGFARVWEARSGRLVAKVRGRSSQLWNEGFVPQALFGPDNRTIVAATGGSTVFVADCAICVPLRGLLAQAAQATTRSLTADERRTFLGE